MQCGVQTCHELTSSNYRTRNQPFNCFRSITCSHRTFWKSHHGFGCCFGPTSSKTSNLQLPLQTKNMPQVTFLSQDTGHVPWRFVFFAKRKSGCKKRMSSPQIGEAITATYSGTTIPRNLVAKSRCQLHMQRDFQTSAQKRLLICLTRTEWQQFHFTLLICIRSSELPCKIMLEYVR